MDKKIIKKYLNNPEICPFCNSGDIEGDNFEAGFDETWRDVSCNNCQEIWRELFTLTDIEKIA